VAEPFKVRDDGRADCRVTAVLKSGIPAQTIRVRFRRVFGGLHPEKGVSAIYFLKTAPAEKDGLFSKRILTYELLSDLNGLAAPTAERLAVVRLAAEGKYGRSGELRVARIDTPAADSLEGMALDAAFVARGVIQEVSLPDPKSKSADCSAVLAVLVEQVFKGDLEPGVIHVYVPAAKPEFTGPNQKPLAPKVGAAALFFRREAQGGSYRLLSPYRGCLPGETARELDEKLATTMVAEKRLGKWA